MARHVEEMQEHGGAEGEDEHKDSEMKEEEERLQYEWHNGQLWAGGR
jgi:hypothetical protein